MRHQLKVQIYNLLQRSLPLKDPAKIGSFLYDDYKISDEEKNILRELKSSLEYYTVSEVHEDDLIEFGVFNCTEDEMEDIAKLVGEYINFNDTLRETLNNKYTQNMVSNVLNKLLEYFDTDEEGCYEVKKIVESLSVWKSLNNKIETDFWNLSRDKWLVFDGLINIIYQIIREKEPEDNEDIKRCCFLENVCKTMLKRIK
jgi:predicted MPP superfamily phosphohydrolase